MNDRRLSWIVDASAVLPIVDVEACSGRAGEWFADAEDQMASSATVDLFDAECANALWKRVRRERWPLEVAELALDRILELPLRRIPIASVVGDALHLAVRLELSVYDACYVALAATSGLPVVTADRRMARAARTLGCEALCLTEVD